MHQDQNPRTSAVRSPDDDPFAEHPGAVARRRRNGRTALLVACAAIVLGRGAWAADSVTYTPEPGPRAVCPLLRPELLDVALPQRDSVQDGSGRTSAGFLGTFCTVNGASGELRVWVTRMGRAEGKSPSEQLEHSGGWIGVVRRVPLGDEALLVNDARLMINQGSYAVGVEYDPRGAVNHARKAEVVLAVGQEVLSQL